MPLTKAKTVFKNLVYMGLRGIYWDIVSIRVQAGNRGYAQIG